MPRGVLFPRQRSSKVTGLPRDVQFLRERKKVRWKVYRIMIILTCMGITTCQKARRFFLDVQDTGRRKRKKKSHPECYHREEYLRGPPCHVTKDQDSTRRVSPNGHGKEEKGASRNKRVMQKPQRSPSTKGTILKRTRISQKNRSLHPIYFRINGSV